MESALIIGASAYLLVGLVDLLQVFVDARRFRAAHFQSKKRESYALTPGRFLYGATWFFGLFLALRGEHIDNRLYMIAGTMIWLGPIIFHYLYGIILRVVGGCTVHLDRYGGWRINSSPKEKTEDD
jgi:hypothetical protein